MHIHAEGPAFFAWLPKMFGKRVVVTVHGIDWQRDSTAKSIVGMMEAEFWKWNGAYKYIDKIICCSEFLKTKMDTNPLFATKTISL